MNQYRVIVLIPQEMSINAESGQQAHDAVMHSLPGSVSLTGAKDDKVVPKVVAVEEVGTFDYRGSGVA